MKTYKELLHYLINQDSLTDLQMSDVATELPKFESSNTEANDLIDKLNIKLKSIEINHIRQPKEGSKEALQLFLSSLNHELIKDIFTCNSFDVSKSEQEYQKAIQLVTDKPLPFFQNEINSICSSDTIAYKYPNDFHFYSKIIWNAWKLRTPLNLHVNVAQLPIHECLFLLYLYAMAHKTNFNCFVIRFYRNADEMVNPHKSNFPFVLNWAAMAVGETSDVLGALDVVTYLTENKKHHSFGTLAVFVQESVWSLFSTRVSKQFESIKDQLVKHDVRSSVEDRGSNPLVLFKYRNYTELIALMNEFKADLRFVVLWLNSIPLASELSRQLRCGREIWIDCLPFNFDCNFYEMQLKMPLVKQLKANDKLSKKLSWPELESKLIDCFKEHNLEEIRLSIERVKCQLLKIKEINGHFLISRFQGGFEHSVSLDWAAGHDSSKFFDFVVFHTLAQNNIQVANENFINNFNQYDLFTKLGEYFQISSAKDTVQWHFGTNQIDMFNMLSGIWTHTWIPNSNLLKHHV